MDIQEVDGLTAQALAELAGAADLAALEALRVKYIGRNGLLPELMQGLKDVPVAGKPAMGQALNRFKVGVTAAVAERKAALNAARDEAARWLPHYEAMVARAAARDVGFNRWLCYSGN